MTTTTQHTPGPWYNRQHSGNTSRVIIAPDGAAVFIVYSIEDARLIAAAPDLLAALNDLLADAVRLGITDSEYSGSAIEARAAIARATGDA